MHEKANFGDNVAREMEFGSFVLERMRKSFDRVWKNIELYLQPKLILCKLSMSSVTAMNRKCLI